VAYEEGGLFVLTMHPQFIGHRSRMVRLDKLVPYMKSTALRSSSAAARRMQRLGLPAVTTVVFMLVRIGFRDRKEA
jgi:hypothetical protein